MRIQPRQQLLEIWRATVRSSFPDGKWVWGGRDQVNSISDAEQLLCLMAPATEIESFKLDEPDQTADDVLAALRPLGDAVELPRAILRVVREYLARYTDESGTPIFSGGTYFVSPDKSAEPTAAQRSLDVVDSFSMSITLMLATLGFIKVFRQQVRRDDLLAEIAELEAMASKRLTAAMVGMLRSFSVYVYEYDSDPGRTLCRTVNQNGLPDRRIAESLRRELRRTLAGLRDITIGSGQSDELDNPNRLFECGWTWGIAKDAPEVETAEDIGEQRKGMAFNAPYLYFTVVALDAIEDLFSERTRLLGLLSEEQLQLSRYLQVRWDLTQSYWSTVASFGEGRWPLEDLPWQTTDGVQSDYLSLLVTSVVVQDLVRRRASGDLPRVGSVLDELADRGRITRRPFGSDPALDLHAPGQRFDLDGTEELGGPRLSWVVSDFAPLLLKRTMRVAGLVDSIENRERLLALADEVWDHLDARRITEASADGLWDQPSGVYRDIRTRYDKPSWYYTERVVQCLITTASVINSRPLNNRQLTDFVTYLLGEADHLYDQELLSLSIEAGPAIRQSLQQVRADLRRARNILHDRPATAVALASDALRKLDQLALARQDAPGVA
jgi:hypothetical protein